jgi:hypothetical protein
MADAAPKLARGRASKRVVFDSDEEECVVELKGGLSKPPALPRPQRSIAAAVLSAPRGGRAGAASAASAPLPSRTEASASWAVRYAPRALPEVALAPKKVEDVRAALDGALEGWRQPPPPPPAEDPDAWMLDAGLVEAAIARSSSGEGAAAEVEEDPDAWMLDGAMVDAAMSGGGQGPPLPPSPRLIIFAGPPGVGKSTAFRLLASSLGLHVSAWAERGRGGGRAAEEDGGLGRTLKDLVLTLERRGEGGEEAPLAHLRRFLTGRVATSAEIAAAEAGTTSAMPSRTVLLLEDVPRAPLGGYDLGAAVEWRAALADVFAHLLSSRTRGRGPVVLIASEGEEVGEAACRPSLARMLGADVLSHPATRLIEVGRVPDGRMLKALRTMAAAAGIGTVLPQRGGVERGLEEALDSIVASARGDLRHASLSLQLLAEGGRSGGEVVRGKRARTGGERGESARPAKRRPRDIDGDAGDTVHVRGKGDWDATGGLGSCGRDDFFDVLHTLGKLLHCKRDVLGELEYDPDTLAAGCPYDAAAMGAFIFESAPAFHTDIGQLASTLGVLGHADVLLAYEWGRRGGASSYRSSAFPEAYAAALATRAVATHNTRPAPRSFAPTRKPAFFAMERVRGANRVWLTRARLGADEDLAEASLASAGGVPGSACTAGTEERAVHVLPAMGLMFRAARFAAPASNGGAWRRGSGFSGRVEALATASCAYGGWKGGGRAGGEDDEDGGDDAGRRVEEEEEGAGAAVPAQGAALPSGGSWEGAAAAAGVDVWRRPVAVARSGAGLVAGWEEVEE